MNCDIKPSGTVFRNLDWHLLIGQLWRSVLIYFGIITGKLFSCLAFFLHNVMSGNHYSLPSHVIIIYFLIMHLFICIYIRVCILFCINNLLSLSLKYNVNQYLIL